MPLDVYNSAKGLKIKGSLAMVVLSTSPASPTNGYYYYNSTNNTFQVYINGAWQTVSTAVYTASNGITKVGQDFRLGGWVNVPTNIDNWDRLSGSFASDFFINARSPNSFQFTRFGSYANSGTFTISSTDINYQPNPLLVIDSSGGGNTSSSLRVSAGSGAYGDTHGLNVTNYFTGNGSTGQSHYSRGISVVSDLNGTPYATEYVQALYLKANKNTTNGNAYAIYSDSGRNWFRDDVEVGTSGKGFVLSSANGTRYRILVSDTGVLSTQLA